MPGRLSVVIPLYNPGALLRVCLDSVARQRFADLEIVPVDDAGPERLRPALEAAAKDDPRIRPVFHEKNRGLAGALNSGLAAATGELVLVLEQDCELEDADGLARAAALIEKDAGLCLTGRRKLHLDEMEPAEVAFTLLRDHMPGPPGGAAPDLVPQSFFELKCDMFPRDALKRLGGFDESFRFSGEDQMLGFRLGEAGMRLFETGALTYTLRSVGMGGVWANLKREVTYGRTQAALLLRTSFKSLGSSAAHAQGARRISNRALSTVSGVALGLLPFAFLLTGFNAWALAFAAPALLRAAVVAARGRLIPRGTRRRSRVVALAVGLAPVDDVVYVAALGIGALVYAATGRS